MILSLIITLKEKLAEEKYALKTKNNELLEKNMQL